MRTLRLWINYDGSDLSGWQRQAGSRSVQEDLEQAVFTVTGSRVTVHGSGRTDAGVHAIAQSAHIRIERGPDASVLHKALNSVLASDIRVIGAREVSAKFHARFSARGKHYMFRISCADVKRAIGRKFSYWHGRDLDLVAMRQASQYFRGCQDFAAMASNPGYRRKRPTVRTISSVHLVTSKHGMDFHVQGDGFLYNMVRTMAGTLVEVGRGRRKPAWVKSVLEAKERSLAGPTLPPHGLFLVKVLYPLEFGGDVPPRFCRKQGLAERA